MRSIVLVGASLLSSSSSGSERWVYDPSPAVGPLIVMGVLFLIGGIGVIIAMETEEKPRRCTCCEVHGGTHDSHDEGGADLGESDNTESRTTHSDLVDVDEGSPT